MLLSHCAVFCWLRNCTAQPHRFLSFLYLIPCVYILISTNSLFLAFFSLIAAADLQTLKLTNLMTVVPAQGHGDFPTVTRL